MHALSTRRDEVIVGAVFDDVQASVGERSEGSSGRKLKREMCSDLSFQTLACITPRGARAPPQSDVTVQNKREYPPPQQVLNGGEDNSICNSSNYES